MRTVVVNLNRDKLKLVDKSTERELKVMHIYGVGSNGNVGSRVGLLMNKKYNEGRKKMSGQGFEKETIPATINAGVTGAKITLDSNRASEIKRPFITVNSEVRDIWGDIDEELDHVSFLPENRPSLTYIYPLSDDEIKHLVDAGLYSNPRFEYLMDNLLSTEQYEITKDVSVSSLELYSEDEERTPIILVDNLGRVEQAFESDEDSDYTSFGYAVQHAADMAIQLEAEGISATQLSGADEASIDDEVDLEIEDVFEVEKDTSSYAEIEERIIEELEAVDEEIDVSDVIDVGQVFGQSSEKQRIEQLRDASSRGVDWDDVEQDDDPFNEDDDVIPEDEFGFDSFSEDDDSLELTDEMVVETDDSDSLIEDDEDEDDWDLEL